MMGKEQPKSALVAVKFKPVHNIPEPHSKQFCEGNRSVCCARYASSSKTRLKENAPEF